MHQPLTVTGLKKSFDAASAVSGVDFSVETGEIVGLIGPNGAGKTTTLKCILGLLQADAGSVRIFGHPAGAAQVKQRIGFMPESPRFSPHLTGREFLTFIGELFNVPALVSQKRIEDLLGKVGLSQAADRRIGGYSKGMVQRLGLAQALMNEPDLLFLDEPLDGLDPLGRIEIRNLLQDIQHHGTAILLSSHILSDVALLCQRIAIMHQGSIRRFEPTEKLVPKGTSLEEVFLATVNPPDHA